MTPQAHPSDPWSTLQAPSLTARDEDRPGIHPSFEDGDTIGYDSRIALPPLCVKCTAIHPSRTKVIRRARGLAAPIELRFPICAACLAAHRQTHVWMFVAGAFLFVIMLAFGMNSLLGNVIPPNVLLLAVLAAWGSTVIKARSEHLEWRIDVAQYDSDGFVRVKGLHREVRAAIMKASASRLAAWGD